MTRSTSVMAALVYSAAVAASGHSAATQPRGGEPLRNAAGLALLVAPEHTDPTLRIVLPDRPASDRTIEVLFPEHVTGVKHGSTTADHLYLFRPGTRGD